MLSYAYDSLKQGDNLDLSKEEFSNIYDLFGKIIANGTSLLIKRGFIREYINITDELPVIRGKIAVNETLKRQSLVRGKIVCEFDELSSNVLFNQIIKSTINTLINYKELHPDIKAQLVKINRYFHDIDVIQLTKSHFSRIRYHRNNIFYKLIIDICEMIYNEVIVNQQKGETLFKDFIQDRQMAALFEKFILNFYKKKINDIKVESTCIPWDKDIDFNHVDDDLLPIMKTDIVLQSAEKQLIIDAKFYADALQSRYDDNMRKFRSTHLYQIYAYINNSRFAGEKSGMLIYPENGKYLDAATSIHGKKIYVKTINLNEDWESIENRLKMIAKESFPLILFK